MAINISSTFKRGGSDMVQLLSYCVYCRKFDPVFVLLAKNFQLMPRSAKAIAIFEEFVTSKAPLRLTIDGSADHLLIQTINKIKDIESSHSMRAMEKPLLLKDEGDRGATGAFAPVLPAKFLFDGLIRTVASSSEQTLSIESDYDPEKSAVQNLPGGKLSGTQLQYVERVWRPARQRLTSAGFRMVANICG